MLPDGWRLVRFGDVVTNVKATTKDAAAAGLERVVGLDHIDPESMPLRRWDLLDDLPDGTSFTRTFKAGQVLFGKRRAYQRKVAVPDFDGICSGDILVFEPSTAELLSRFLPYVVESEGFFDHALGTSAGSLSPRTKWQEIAKYEFGLPPADEQARMAEVLAGSERLRQSYYSAKAAAQSRWLSSAASHFDTEKVVPLELVAEVELGKKRDPKLQLHGTPTKYLRAANVKFGTFELDDVLEMNFTPAEVEKFRLVSGDVMVTEGCGSLSEIGACATWDHAPDDLCFQMTLLRLRARESSLALLLHHWAAFSFRSGAFARVASGTSVFHLSAARVRKMSFPDMSEAAREDAVADLEACDAIDRTTRGASEAADRLAVGLRESILQGVARVQ